MQHPAELRKLIAVWIGELSTAKVCTGSRTDDPLSSGNVRCSLLEQTFGLLPGSSHKGSPDPWGRQPPQLGVYADGAKVRLWPVPASTDGMTSGGKRFLQSVATARNGFPEGFRCRALPAQGSDQSDLNFNRVVAMPRINQTAGCDFIVSEGLREPGNPISLTRHGQQRRRQLGRECLPE